MKISQSIELYWLDKQLEFSKTSIVSYNTTFKHFVGFMKDADIEKVTKRDILRFLNYLETERKNSRRTVSDSLIKLSSLWTWAGKELGIAHICRDIEVSFTEKIVEPFTEDEVKRLVAATTHTQAWENIKDRSVRSKKSTALLDKALILELVETGIRAQELCDLKVKDFDVKTGKLFIEHGKNDKERIVMLGFRTRKALMRYLATRETKPNEPLFSTRTNNSLQRDNLRHKLERIGEVAKVDNVHPHRFRHTFAINFLRNGGNLFTLQALLGHSSLQMVQRYAKIVETDIEKSTEHSVSDNWKL